MKYIASVRDKETKERKILTYDYPTKKAFRSGLEGNGYTVYFITTEENFDEDCEKYHERYERQKRVQKLLRDSDKKAAERMDMTVAEYRAWLKA
jgi:predicted ATP-dependent protease